MVDRFNILLVFDDVSHVFRDAEYTIMYLIWHHVKYDHIKHDYIINFIFLGVVDKEP